MIRTILWSAALACAACDRAQTTTAPPPPTVPAAVAVRSGPSFVISASWPDGGVTAIASAVAAPLEKELGKIAGVARLTSTSTASDCRIVVELAPDGDDQAGATAVAAAITAAQPLLPPALLTPPTFHRAGAVSARFAIANPDDATRVASQLAQLAGTADVDVCGVPSSAVNIELDSTKLAATGIAITDVITALDNLKDTAAGSIASALPPIVIAIRKGSPIRLEDVGAVSGPVPAADCHVLTEASAAAPAIVTVTARRDAPPTLASQLATTAGAPALPALHAIEIELALDVDPVRGAIALRDAIAAVPAARPIVIEYGGHTLGPHVRAWIGGGDSAMAAVTAQLATQPTLAHAGAATTAVALIAPDVTMMTSVARKAIGALDIVATHGLATHVVRSATVDHDAATRLGLAAAPLDAAVALTAGRHLRATTLAGVPVTISVAAGGQPLSIPTAAHGSVPLDAVAHLQTRPEPDEIVHRGQLPAIVLDVRGDAAAIRAAVAQLKLPVGMSATFEPITD